MEERELRALERVADALERVAGANERLNELADSERLPEPPEPMFDAPSCPHCGTLDPGTHSEGGEGKLSEFVLVASCSECGQMFFCLPLGWRIVGDRDKARQLLNGDDPLLRGDEG